MSHTFDEILSFLESQTLSEALSPLETFATRHGLDRLLLLVHHELHGYPPTTVHFPPYRIVQTDYFDTGAQSLPAISQQYGSVPLHHSVAKLELHLKNGLTMKLAPAMTEFLSQAANTDVFGAYVRPDQLKSAIEGARLEALKELSISMQDANS